ncbi:hypothetical protein GCM10019059_42390 [Camelimonas fluminis]|nr:hypothetical protein GCM10019059_42390 [Camelimonas fluminis]
MATEQYVWGTERPVRQVARKRLRLDRSEAAFAALEARYRAEKMQMQRDIDILKAEVRVIEIATASGRYDRDAGLAAAEQHGVYKGAPKRGRGHPRKYVSDEARPPRQTRAKTADGRLRFAAGDAVRRKRGGVDPVCDNVSSVTASTARGVAAPGLAPEFERRMLSTVAMPDAHDAAPELAVETNVQPYPADGVEGGSDLPPGEPEPAAKRFGVEIVRIKYKRDPFDEGPDPALRELRTLHAAMNQEWLKHQIDETTYERLPYDFSHPHDPSKVPPELLRAFRGFGLPWVYPIDPRDVDKRSTDVTPRMCEEDFGKWVGPALFPDSDDMQKDAAEYLELYRRPYALWGMHSTEFERAVRIERDRPSIWPVLAKRVEYVEFYHHVYKRGEITLDHAKVLTAWEDVYTISRLTYHQQHAFHRGEKFMKWFEGFSVLDLRNWAGSDLGKHRECRTYSGFPKWAFPERLHAKILRGDFLEPWSDLRYEAPTEAEFAEFVREHRGLIG